MGQRKGRMVIISGPSGVGKGSVNNVLREDPHLNLEYSVSMTTRQPRNGEIDGVHYFFVSEQEFAEAIVKKELIEYAHFVGNAYGTPRKYVEEQMEKGKNVILEIEVDGATQVLKNEKDVLSIFLMPPTLTELANRIAGRKSESEETLKARLDKAMLEIPLKHNYQYVVENDSVENAVAKITDILEHENAAEPNGKTMYQKLNEMVTEIVKESYQFFVENWEANVKLLADDAEEIEEAEDFDAEANLIEILTEQCYHKVLGHGDFKKLADKEYVIGQIQRLMFRINFFSIDQKKGCNE
ncbi:guanylate kinase [[Acholeplasma] multilocale]|uniref:guanylate kinase n=1 Tax=[Acholeplasma] multilocale TaxID=264638 RepID=UPI0004790196|nr:guanylate kinase [[Acholeplasma] multilocale]